MNNNGRRGKMISHVSDLAGFSARRVRRLFHPEPEEKGRGETPGQTTDCDVTGLDWTGRNTPIESSEF